ncbi:Sorting nexin-4 [Hanseniaspora uvarum]|uniref:Sorting nexin-4 n=1 Tax=Hanseniaspora uvarum TaxID=29833 RepID=A0A1E5RXL3_HANUV|nr:Sorting nexin-4 [Hanseniaspora uvarum]
MSDQVDDFQPSHYKYNVIVSDPQKKRVEETHDSFISYSIAIRTDNPDYHSKDKGKNQDVSEYNSYDDLYNIDNTVVTRKRYSDFLILNQFLKIDYPLINVPKLPPKNNYSIKQIYHGNGHVSQNAQNVLNISGTDQTPAAFGHNNIELDDGFLLRRLYSLEFYLNTLVNHSSLQNYSLLITFMTSDAEWEVLKNTIQFTKDHASLGQSSVEDEISEYLMNVFKKPAKEFKEIKEIKMKLEKLIYNLNKILKGSLKLNKIQELIVKDFSHLQKLKYDVIAQDKSNIRSFDSSATEKHYSAFQDNMNSSKLLLSELHKFNKYENLNKLQEMINYLKQLFDLIRLLDYKQLDLESLQDTSNKLQMDKKKYENVNIEKAKKIDLKIQNLEGELQECNKQVVSIFQVILQESENIEYIKDLQLKKLFKELAIKKVEFYRGMCKVWAPK